MTKKEIIEKLEYFGVEFNPKKNKSELQKLLSDVETIIEEEKVEQIEEEIENEELEVEEEKIVEEVKVVKEKQDTYAGKKVLSRKKIKINGIDRESILLESLENIIL